MAMDDYLAEKENLYAILTRDVILTENTNTYLKNIISSYGEILMHTIFCLYIDELEKNILDKEMDLIINRVQFMVANKKIDAIMKEWRTYINSIRSRYGKRYDLARNRYSCYLAALYMEHEPNIEYQSFINDIVEILNITPKNQLWGYRTRIRSIFNKLQRKENK